MFKVHVKVANPEKPHFSFEEDFWVDTGAMYSFVPEDRLQEIKLEPLHARELILADGRHVRRFLGAALFTITNNSYNWRFSRFEARKLENRELPYCKPAS